MSKDNIFSFRKNLGSGWLYFYIHFVTEIVCFYCMTLIVGDSAVLWLFPLIYDAMAFVPQSLLGRLSDKLPGIPLGVIGAVLMSAATVMFNVPVNFGKYTALLILCFGNAAVHVNGAEVTLRSSEGKLSHSALFVSGGSFGVISGKLIAKAGIPFWLIAVFSLTIIPFVLLAEEYRRKADRVENPCEKFQYGNPGINPALIILIATLVVTVRGYMGYGIPTAWKKTTFQTVMLYCTMGIGKGAGGILSDIFGVRKTALFSTLMALPFLLAGDRHMIISLIGVMFFSMTMSITLALLVSVLQKAPGLAFGFTTIGLFIGTAPIFFFEFSTVKSNCIVISVLTVLCTIALAAVLRKDGKRYE